MTNKQLNLRDVGTIYQSSAYSVNKWGNRRLRVGERLLNHFVTQIHPPPLAGICIFFDLQAGFRVWNAFESSLQDTLINFNDLKLLKAD